MLGGLRGDSRYSGECAETPKQMAKLASVRERLTGDDGSIRSEIPVIGQSLKAYPGTCA